MVEICYFCRQAADIDCLDQQVSRQDLEFDCTQHFSLDIFTLLTKKEADRFKINTDNPLVHVILQQINLYFSILFTQTN